MKINRNYSKSRQRVYKACTHDKKTIFKFDTRKYGISPLWVFGSVIAQMKLAALLLNASRPKNLHIPNFSPGGIVPKSPLIVGETGSELIQNKDGYFWPICAAYGIEPELLHSGKGITFGMDLARTGADKITVTETWFDENGVCHMHNIIQPQSRIQEAIEKLNNIKVKYDE